MVGGFGCFAVVLGVLRGLGAKVVLNVCGFPLTQLPASVLSALASISAPAVSVDVVVSPEGDPFLSALEAPSCGVPWAHKVRVGIVAEGALEGSRCFADAALKLVLNSITTGGHVLKGKPWGGEGVVRGVVCCVVLCRFRIWEAVCPIAPVFCRG